MMWECRYRWQWVKYERSRRSLGGEAVVILCRRKCVKDNCRRNYRDDTEVDLVSKRDRDDIRTIHEMKSYNSGQQIGEGGDRQSKSMWQKSVTAIFFNAFLMKNY